MKIKTVELFKTSINMNFNFTSSKGSMNNRETIVIKITDSYGNFGYGEVVALKEPFYTDETIDISLRVLEEEYIDKLMNLEIDHPFYIHKIIDLKYPMTKAAIEAALVDLYCRKNNIKVMEFLFKSEDILSHIKGGMVLGDMGSEELSYNIKKFLEEGYERFKLKVKPRESLEKIKRIRYEFPELKLLVDANRSFTLDDLGELREYDKLKLLCIEEPIDYDNLKELAFLQDKLTTPICLDEGILKLEDLKKAISLKAFKILNIKSARLGGLYYTKEAINICRENNIKFWMGSMVESGIGKMVQVNLARLKDNFIEGDLSSSTRYFKSDLIKPALEFNKGIFKMDNTNSFCYEVDEDKLSQYTIYYRKKEV